MAANNSVALSNGIPVDLVTGWPIFLEEPVLVMRVLLRKKLDLQFLDDPKVDEHIIREGMNPQLAVTGLAPLRVFDEYVAWDRCGAHRRRSSDRRSRKCRVRRYARDSQEA